MSVNKKQRRINWHNVLTGAILFAAGDSIGALLTGGFLYQRMLGMMLLGGSLYAWEIPAYFAHLQCRFNKRGLLNAFKRTLAAGLFFNPLWITRHFVFIKLFSGQWQTISPDILVIATESFIFCFPFSLLVNYLIQNVISLRKRFLVSSVYSALTVIYFALSEVLFAVAG
ncbi:MAG: hypothetical protein HOE45_02935 [Gammaproteobacteria bacterium]|jgi:hypothetical protein|nr:hypothetical protein [Gammaproteobacteria bacterium]MBT4145826.1 hypothetical protein [Gammaproteobacteria bacterium]MBT5222924.1 hypothetical protein [Gammaproteobacteria bacterium]MBT5826909.1 hypothetical protein [Gammaproteobacteria bacterium]MBT5966806.1 hypothetical protein [Gammaproteobacteria bacterium]